MKPASSISWGIAGLYANYMSPHHFDVTNFRDVPIILTSVTALIAKLWGMCYIDTSTHLDHGLDLPRLPRDGPTSLQQTPTANLTLQDALEWYEIADPCSHLGNYHGTSLYVASSFNTGRTSPTPTPRLGPDATAKDLFGSAKGKPEMEPYFPTFSSRPRLKGNQ